ncbi:MAG: hypothetical protein MUO76_12115 [Anaerolineaceae bacterium]|nr:hypothetical protein [Anaerolineaceae bacterium]
MRDFTPDTVRMMLTRYVNTDIVLRAVNEVNVYRFLPKSSTPAILKKTVEDSITHYQSIITEKESLSKTLVSSIRTLIEILGILNPMAFSKTIRVRTLVSHIVREMKLEDEWKFEMAATLSQIGLLTYPSSLLEKIATNQPLSPAENQQVSNHPSVGREMISRIPRLEAIAEMIGKQYDSCKDLAFDEETREEYIISLGANIIKTALDYDQLIESGSSHGTSIFILSRSEDYRKDIIAALRRLHPDDSTVEISQVSLEDLKEGMIIVDDIFDKYGSLLITRGREVTYPLLIHLFKLSRKPRSIREPFAVISFK